MFHKKIKKTINLRNARIIVGNKTLEVKAQPNYAQRVKITTKTSEKITR